MIVNDRLTSYLHSLDSRESEIIEAIGREARADRVPIIRQETGSLLKVLLKMNKPQRILEIGTAVAYSAILMSECLEPGATITTVEKYEKRIPIARENFKRAGKEAQITLLEGDAGEILAGLSGSFDFIFMDPPYNHLYEKQVLERLSGSPLIKESTLIIAEASRETDTSYIPSLGFCISRVKEYKTNKHLFITPARRLGDS